MDRSDFANIVKDAHEKTPKPTALDFVISQGGVVSAWGYRYGNYVWVGVAPDYSLSILEDARNYTESADIEALGFCEYLNGKGQWLPFESGETVSTAISNLARKLGEYDQDILKRASAYWESVEETFRILSTVSDGNYGISSAIDAHMLPDRYRRS